jgi:hypothetical protein
MPDRRRVVKPPIEEIKAPILPINPPHEVPHPNVTNRIAAASVSLSAVSGERAWLWGYQRVKLGNGLKIQYTFKNTLRDVWIVYELCKGECDALVTFWINGRNYTATANEVHQFSFDLWWYPGTAAGQVNTQLAAADTTWNEAFAGTCYAVLHLWNLDTDFPQLPTVEFEQRCYKPIDPRTDLRAYSENPHVQWYDWLLDAEGKKEPAARINKPSFITAANISDELVGTRKRFESHLSLVQKTEQNDVIAAFKMLTDSFFWFEAGQWKVVVDRPATAVATYDDNNISSSVPVRAARSDDFEKPNTLYLEFTDTVNAVSGWKPKLLGPFQTAAAASGAEDEVAVTYRMPWIHNEGCATSRAKYLLNSYLYDMKLLVRWNETTSDRLLGDLVTQSVPARGLTYSGRFISRTKTPEKNVYDVVLLEYSAARYSDDIVSTGAKTGSTLPDPADIPPDVTLGTVTITEELFQEQVGFWKTRARAVITNPDFYFLDAVELHVSVNGGEYRYYGDFPGGSAVQRFLFYDSINEINVPYSFKFITRSKFGPRSAGMIKTPASTFVGKTALPADPVSLVASANGNVVTLIVQPSADQDSISYEYRRGETTDTWSSAMYLQQTKSHNYSDRPPFGKAYRYFVKAVDSGKRYSANAATYDVTLNAIGAEVAEAANSMTWNSSFVRTSIPPNDTGVGGVWRGSGNLFVAEVRLADGSYRQWAYLCRTDVGRVAAETERAAAGYTVAQWRTLIDDPRRKGAPLWAPLPAGANGEIYGSNGLINRQHDNRTRLLRISHSGLDTPDNIALAQSFFAITPDFATPPANKNYESTILTEPKNQGYWNGIRLSSNSPYYQEIVRDDGGGKIIGISKTPRPYVFVRGTATTDGSGLFVISYSTYANSNGALGSTWITPRALAKSAGKVILIDSIDAAAKTVTFKSYSTVDGSVVTGVAFAYELEDNAGTMAAVFW